MPKLSGKSIVKEWKACEEKRMAKIRFDMRATKEELDVLEALAKEDFIGYALKIERKQYELSGVIVSGIEFLVPNEATIPKCYKYTKSTNKITNVIN